MPQASNGAIIGNGMLQLGINPEGHLVVMGENGEIGLHYLPGMFDGLRSGCNCEGWGAADAVSGITGYANHGTDGIENLSLVDFTATETTAVSVVRVGSTLSVTHDYHPSSVPNLYEVTVTLQNISDTAIDARYRRVMDWDIEPTEYEEYVTAHISTSAVLRYNNNDGFATANPLGEPTSNHITTTVTGNFTHVGPADHGALFDFGFDALAPGEIKRFALYYGADDTSEQALTTLDDVDIGADTGIYSLAEDSSTGGSRNTFIFGFKELACQISNDSDCDGLTDKTEREKIDTNPFNADTDGDGLLDSWEVDPELTDPLVDKPGFNLDDDPEIEVTREEVFKPWAEAEIDIATGSDEAGRVTSSPFAGFVRPPDPRHKDLYLELDWLDCLAGDCPEVPICVTPIFVPQCIDFHIDPMHHAPSLDALHDVVNAFRNAPLSNPDDVEGINLHILIDEQLPHRPNCDQGSSSLRPEHFGTATQQDNPLIIQAKEQVFRYVWSGHSTAFPDHANCPVPDLHEMMLQGLGWMALPAYDYSSFGQAYVGGRDILVSLGPLWICPEKVKILGFPPCFRSIPHPGIFPAKVPVNGQVESFSNPMHKRFGLSENQGIQQLWGRTLMHLLGHALGLEENDVVKNDPRLPSVDVDGDGKVDTLRPLDSYGRWDELEFAPRGEGTATSEQDYPAYDGNWVYDSDGDSVADGIDNCLGVSNPGLPPGPCQSPTGRAPSKRSAVTSDAP